MSALETIEKLLNIDRVDLPGLGTSHKWVAITPDNIRNDEWPGYDDGSTVDLHGQYRLSSTVGEAQDAWDRRKECCADLGNGISIGTVVFNLDSERRGKIHVASGYKTEPTKGIEACVATSIAVENPNYVVVATGEQNGAKGREKLPALLRKDPNLYMDNYMRNYEVVSDKFGLHGITKLILSGRSKGAFVSAEMARRDDIQDVAALVIADAPGAKKMHPYHLGLKLALEDLDRYKGATLQGIDEVEERFFKEMLKQIPKSEAESFLVKARDFLFRDLWLGRLLATDYLPDSLEASMNKRSQMLLANFHGRGNLAMPLEDTRKMMLHLYKKYGDRIFYMESDCRHFAEGHTPRFARQLAWTIDQLD